MPVGILLVFGMTSLLWHSSCFVLWRRDISRSNAIDNMRRFDMLPLGDDDSDRRTVPFVTYALIAINVLVFVLLELPQGNNLDAFLTRWGTIPAQIVNGNGLITLITSMFLHGGWLHLGSN